MWECYAQKGRLDHEWRYLYQIVTDTRCKNISEMFKCRNGPTKYQKVEKKKMAHTYLLNDAMSCAHNTISIRAIPTFKEMFLHLVHC